MSDRLQDALRQVLAALLPELVYYTAWEYQVLAATPLIVAPLPMPAGTTVKIDCVAVDPPVVATFPRTLSGLPVWPGPSGLVAIPLVGTLVRVGFLNGDPTKPHIQALQPGAIPSGSALASFATVLSTAATIPQIVAAGTLLRQELTRV